MLVGGWVALRQHPGVLGYVTRVRGMSLAARGRRGRRGPRRRRRYGCGAAGSRGRYPPTYRPLLPDLTVIIFTTIIPINRD